MLRCGRRHNIRTAAIVFRVVRRIELSPDDEFRARKAGIVVRLVRVGVPRRDAQAWIDYWDASTAMLAEFRRAPDYWDLGYEFALAEWMTGNEAPGTEATG
jgi:hypothetical protein